MRFAVSQFTTKPWSFGADMDNYRAVGIENIEICEDKLARDPQEAASQMAIFKERGYTPVSIQPRVHSLFPDRMAPEPRDPHDRATCIRKSIEYFSNQFPGVDLPYVVIAGVVPDGNLREGWETARRLLPELARVAEDKGSRIAFEPLAPENMYFDTFIHGLNQGISLVESVGRENFGLVVDCWHLWQEERLQERLREWAKKVFVVHACDWPKKGPRTQDDRVLPGEGAIDLEGIFSALSDGGYAGPCALEVLSDRRLPDSLWKLDAVELLRRGRDSLAPFTKKL